MGTKRTTVELDEETVEWLNSTFGPRRLWGIINECLKEFRIAYESQPPVNYYKLGAERLKERILTEVTSDE